MSFMIMSHDDAHKIHRLLLWNPSTSKLYDLPRPQSSRSAEIRTVSNKTNAPNIIGSNTRVTLRYRMKWKVVSWRINENELYRRQSAPNKHRWQPATQDKQSWTWTCERLRLESISTYSKERESNGTNKKSAFDKRTFKIGFGHIMRDSCAELRAAVVVGRFAVLLADYYLCSWRTASWIESSEAIEMNHHLPYISVKHLIVSYRVVIVIIDCRCMTHTQANTHTRAIITWYESTSYSD